MTRAVVGDRLIDGQGGVIDGKAVVLIEGKRIRQVGPWSEVELPGDAQVVDMAGCTLMPGMIDTHLHLCAFNARTFSNYRVASFEIAPQLQIFYAMLHAQMCFEMGFTTLRDLGWVGYAGQLVNELIALREAINNGVVPGPRLRVAGWAVVTGSHLDLVMPRNALRVPGVTADGPWELRKLARTHLRAGCDIVKTCASGGGGTDKEEADVRNMTQEELDAIADEAHAFKKVCSCHCFTPEAQRMAVRAGVDTIEHCVFTDDEAIAMMRDGNKILVPTLAHRSDRAIEIRRQLGTSEFVLKKMKAIQPHTRETFHRVHEAGIKIAMGTDTQFDPEMGQNAHELEIYVDYGMTPMEAIQTATGNAAEALHMSADVGTLGAGRLADVIAVKGDPLSDITLLQGEQNIRMVMKEGTVYVDRRPGMEKRVIVERPPVISL